MEWRRPESSVEARIILGCIPLLHGFWSALPASDKAFWELTEKLYHAGVPWSSSLICCWTCWELSLYLASTLWKMRAEQLSCVSGILWVTREGFGTCSRMFFSEVPVVNEDFFFSFLEKVFQKRGLRESHSASGWFWWSQSAELSYIGSFHLQLALIHDCTVLNPLKVCKNMLVGGHL